ncbi:hypothetical protein ACIQVR_01690 [Streptomyces xanthochromogenes]|uniref:hypothetical protein n=1 Tax=Streptomyces xanthochromogenes TaxID=67384 RepID=UPI00382BF9AF
MDDVLPLFAIFGGLAAVLAALVWLARHVRRRGTAGAGVAAALASWEEAYRVTAHESHWEIKAQAERQFSVLSPDGHWPRAGEGNLRPAASRRRRDGKRLRRLVRLRRPRG